MVWCENYPLTDRRKFSRIYVRIRGRDQWEQRFIISHIPNNKSLFPSYSTSLLSVPVFTETLRKTPTLSLLERKCCSDYELPATTGNWTITLPSGTGVYLVYLSIRSPFWCNLLPRTAEVRSRRFHRGKQTQSTELHISSIWRWSANVHR